MSESLHVRPVVLFFDKWVVVAAQAHLSGPAQKQHVQSVLSALATKLVPFKCLTRHCDNIIMS